MGPNGLLQKAGFRGFVVSDWGATHDSAAKNANAGLDMEQPGDFIFIGMTSLPPPFPIPAILLKWL